MRAFNAGLAFASGAVLMYGFDPNLGRRRRARVRNELDHLAHAVPRSLRKASADSAHRVHGKLTHLQHLSAATVEDDVLDGRVRAAPVSVASSARQSRA